MPQTYSVDRQILYAHERIRAAFTEAMALYVIADGKAPPGRDGALNAVISLARLDERLEAARDAGCHPFEEAFNHLGLSPYLLEAACGIVRRSAHGAALAFSELVSAIVKGAGFTDPGGLLDRPAEAERLWPAAANELRLRWFQVKAATVVDCMSREMIESRPEDDDWAWCEEWTPDPWWGPWPESAGVAAPVVANAPTTDPHRVSPLPAEKRSRPADPTAPPHGNSRLGHTEIATTYGLPPEALRKRLERFRFAHSEGWQEVPDTERGPRDPRYLYVLSAVMPVVNEMLAELRNASGERPAKSKNAHIS
jgi:hypothetical protein